tara:strand:+ start:1212 stop:1955 length:744 start_codon:yes stop_codon:yes gene_type:complete
MKNAQNNEVDLFNLMETLWISRRLIGIFVFIALLFAGGIISLKNPVYISMISMSIDTSPAGYTRAREVMVDFEKMFYSKKIFNNWKRENISSIEYPDFSRTQKINRFTVSRDNERTSFILLKGTKAYIQVISDQLSVSNDYFNYANYINDKLLSDQIKKANEEQKRIEKLYKDSTSRNTKYLINLLLSTDRHLSNLSQGEKIIEIQFPTQPEMTEPKILRIFGIALFLGLVLGIIYSVIRQACHQRK